MLDRWECDNIVHIQYLEGENLKDCKNQGTMTYGMSCCRPAALITNFYG